MKLRKISPCILVIILTGMWYSSFATHNRAGEITYRLISPFVYEATITTYTKGSSVDADRDSLTIDWGDATQDDLPRINGPDGDFNGIPDGENLSNDIKKNVYRGIHTYSGPLPFYIISLSDPNRIDMIINISGGASVFVPFYLEDTMRFMDIPSVGFNSSPVLLNPPIDFANVGDTFYHNPNAWDIEGDSLYYTLVNPKSEMGISVPDYRMPDEVIPGPDNQFIINHFTGEITWAVPQLAGIYNIAILINEFRNGLNLGNILRDMQIIVEDNPNDPPRIVSVNDTCVVAGDTLIALVNASDPQSGQIVTLTAEGGPFQLGSPAVFTTVSGNPCSGSFFWKTECEHIRAEPYTVVFKAEDDFETVVSGTVVQRHLVDLETWKIQVIAPAPENLTAAASGNVINLQWDNPYTCASFENFRGFSVWRRNGSNPFVPGYCETGLEGKGYVKIADGITDYTYADKTAARGNEYCYRILAHFSKLSPNGLFESDISESIPSNEACAQLKQDLPIITNVDVDSTDTGNGRIIVKWVSPLADAALGIDTLSDPAPYRYDVLRKEGFTTSTNPFTVLHSFNAPSFAALLADTLFVDSLGLNTTDHPYTYAIRFFSNAGADSIGTSTPASSVYLSIAPFDKSLLLNMLFTTPWQNDSFTIFRQNHITLSFDSVALSYATLYLDTGLTNDTQYCYYATSYGAYSLPFLPRPLINRSQIKCESPRDTVAPCPPVLQVHSPCEELGPDWQLTDLINTLFWNMPPDSCAYDLHKVAVYFQPAGSDKFSLIDTTAGRSDTDFAHLLATLPTGLAGCYKVTAIDYAGNESEASNTVCVDNCPLYDLPNTFTPNADGQNDLYTPRLPYRFVTRVEFAVYDKWGVKVFETTNPMLNWDGNDYKNGKACPDGVYYYGGYYYVQMLSGEVQFALPGGKKGAGFIHLIRSKS